MRAWFLSVFLCMELLLKNLTAVEKGRDPHVTMARCSCFVRCQHPGAISLSELQAFSGFLVWAWFDCRSACKTCAWLERAVAPLLQKDVVWCVVYAGSMRDPCVMFWRCPAGGPETRRNGRFTYKAKKCWFNYTFSMQRKRSRKEFGWKWARKAAARKPQEPSKKATRE